MTDEPIAMRTRSYAVYNKLYRMSSATALMQKMNKNQDDMMARFYKINQQVKDMDRDLKYLRRQAVIFDKCSDCPGKCENIAEHFKLEHTYKETYNKLKNFKVKIFHLKQTANCLLVNILHASNCKASDDCLLRMQKVLKQDPLSLERKREIEDKVTGKIISTRRHSALHDAVSKNHVKCVKFLLERGARVTSLATFENNTVLHTLYYNIRMYRMEVLELLLKYGVACMFQHNQAGELALKVATSSSELNEVSLLLQHGATMSEQQLETSLTEAWKMYNLLVIKRYALHYSKRFCLCPGGYSISSLLVHHCYRQMVLAEVPIHLCHEKLLEALQFYKVLGGKFHASSENGSNENLMQYLKSYKHKRYFHGVKKRIKALVSNPLSLKEISRLAVRNCILVDYVENIKKLEVPVDLEPFLRFDDVPITELPDKYQEFDDVYTSSENDSDMEL